MTACLAPSPIASIAITDATPITMPSSVSTDRNTLARSARNAVFVASATSAPCEMRPRRGCHAAAALWLAACLRTWVGNNVAVLDLDHARRVLGDFACVCDQNHGVTLRPQLFQLPHHVGAALAVQRAGRLVGQDHAAAVHQRARNRHALLLPA